MGPLGLVELQRGGERLQNLLGGTAQIATLELGVVVDADAGEQGHLLAPQASDAPAAAVGRQARLCGRDPGPT